MCFLPALALSAAKTLANCNALFHQQICGGLEVLCVITTVISDLVLSLLTMNCQPVTLLRPQNSVETNTPTPSPSLTHRGLNVWRRN